MFKNCHIRLLYLNEVNKIVRKHIYACNKFITEDTHKSQHKKKY